MLIIIVLYQCRLVFAISAASIGSSFQHGWNTGVINIPKTVRIDLSFFKIILEKVSLNLQPKKKFTT